MTLHTQYSIHCIELNSYIKSTPYKPFLSVSDVTHLGVLPVILLRVALYMTYPLVAEKRVHTTSMRTYPAPMDMKAGISQRPTRVTIWEGKDRKIFAKVSQLKMVMGLNISYIYICSY